MPINPTTFALNTFKEASGAMKTLPRNNSQPPTDEVIENRKSLQRLSVSSQDGSFGDMIRDAINSVDRASKTADKQVEDVVSGKSENIHEVMISLQKAQLSFQLMLEVRNKAIEAYQELSRMQI
jgi:flagellar hook-basal body complex protein FliE